MIRLFIVIAFIHLNYDCYAQCNTSPDKIHVYIFQSRYDDSMRTILESEGFKLAKLFTSSSIQGKSDNIDSQKIKKSIEQRYPDVNDSGVCVIDWEGIYYKNLKKLSKTDTAFLYAEQQFLQCIQIMKAARPKLKIGIYGMPFSIYRQRQVNSENDISLQRILSQCDFIAPSLYIHYQANQVRESENLNYLKNNLQAALALGSLLNKPVIPFFWHRIHPTNKKFGNTPIPLLEFNNYLDVIAGESYNGKKTSGVFWWEYSQASQLKYIKKQNNVDNNTLISTYKTSFLSIINKN